LLKNKETEKLIQKVKHEVKVEEINQIIKNLKLDSSYTIITGLLSLGPILLYLLIADPYPMSSHSRTELFSTNHNLISVLPLILGGSFIGFQTFTRKLGYVPILVTAGLLYGNLYQSKLVDRMSSNFVFPFMGL
jgi:hypothetical protein